MKFCFNMPHSMELKALVQQWEYDVTGADQARMARCAEELGYDMIAVPEHFLVPDSHVALSGPHYFHSTVAQSFLAGATTRIPINSCVTLLPLQHPVVLAKALATADWMSGGRIMVTFGVGWDPEEFRLLGVDFHKRGEIADEYLAAIIELWTSDSPRFEARTSASATQRSRPNRSSARIFRSGSAATPMRRCGAPRASRPGGSRS